MAKTKKFKPDIKKVVKDLEEAEHFPRYVKRSIFCDVGKFVRLMGKYLVYEFKVKGELASPVTSIGDTIHEITEHEYMSTAEEEIYEKIVDVYRSGKPIDQTFSHQIFNPNTGETIKPEKDKPTERPIGKNGEVDQKSLRDKLNSKDISELKNLCSSFSIDVNAYNHLSGGLLKMSLVNKLVGTIGKQLTKGTITSQEMEERIK